MWSPAFFEKPTTKNSAVDTSWKVYRTNMQSKRWHIITTNDLKWNKHTILEILEISSKANRMLGCARRTALAINDVSVRKVLDMTMVRNELAYCCQVWAPQSVNNISTIEQVQRRATKFILSLPYNTNISYKERLVTIGIIPTCYWHEYLDMVYLFKCIIAHSDSNITSRSVCEKRGHQRLNRCVPKCKTAAFQNSYVRVANVWNTLPCCIKDTSKTLVSFKVSLKRHYKGLTSLVYNPEVRELSSLFVLNVIQLVLYSTFNFYSNMLLNFYTVILTDFNQ